MSGKTGSKWKSKKPLSERFWAKVDVNSDPGRCWDWTGKRRELGYGVFRGWESKSIKEKRAHRLAWELMYGEIPDGLFVCHHCDNPPCCNSYHLFLGSQADNMHDMHAKGRQGSYPAEIRSAVMREASQRQDRRGEKNANARHSPETVLEIRRRWAAGGVTQKGLSRELGVPRTTVRRIIDEESWAHLKERPITTAGE